MTICACEQRPGLDSVPLWQRWTCPDCGSEWIADEPAPQMETEWMLADSWEWLPKLAREPWRT